MNIHFFRTILLASVVLLTVGCANSSFYHRNVMVGQIVETSDNEAVACIGTQNGAEVGQVLDVYRPYIDNNVVREGKSRWARKHVGKVRIDKIIDKHFASAKIVEGDVSQNDIVELDP